MRRRGVSREVLLPLLHGLDMEKRLQRTMGYT